MDMDLMKLDLSQAGLSERKLADDLAALSSYSRGGLVITPQIAGELAASRREALERNARTELRADAIVRLVRAFMDSAFIPQDELSYVLGELIDLFYYIKTETGGALSDDELISEMYAVFNGMCGGDIEDMQSRGLEKILRRTNWGDAGIWSGYESTDEEERSEDWRE